MWNKIKAWFKNSLTILWARLVVLVSAVMGVLDTLNGDPNTQSLINALLTPKSALITLAIVGIVTELARRRTAGK